MPDQITGYMKFKGIAPLQINQNKSQKTIFEMNIDSNRIATNNLSIKLDRLLNMTNSTPTAPSYSVK